MTIAAEARIFLVSYNSYTVLNCVFDGEAMLLELQNTHLAVYVIEIECLKSLFTWNLSSQINIYLKLASQITIYLRELASQITIYHDIVSSSVSNHYLPSKSVFTASDLVSQISIYRQRF